MFLFAGLTIAGMRGGFTGTTRPITISNAIEKVKKPIESAIVLNTPFSIIRTINARTFEEVKFFDEKEAEKIYTPIHEGYPAGNFKPMNVVVLILESFTKEVVGSLNPELEGGALQRIHTIPGFIDPPKLYLEILFCQRGEIDRCHSVGDCRSAFAGTTICAVALLVK